MTETAKRQAETVGKIRVAVAGLGNCASSLIEGLNFYRQHPDSELGLLFPQLCGYRVSDIEIVAAFDISARKVGRPVREAIYEAPNNFLQLDGVRVESGAEVFRGPTLDGNPPHLAQLVPEAEASPVDVSAVLREVGAEILVNLLPTGSIEATRAYAEAAFQAGCAFINAIPTPLAQVPEYRQCFAAKQLPLFGDDIKSQVGTTILHRALLTLLHSRGSTLQSSTQINIGGNTDFANFVHRGETKLVSKRKSLQALVGEVPSHVGHHFDPTKGPWKNALIKLESLVFGGSKVKIEVHLESDDKPNAAGALVDLIRLAKGALDRGIGGSVPEVCAYYMKSPPVEMADLDALEAIRSQWHGTVSE